MKSKTCFSYKGKPLSVYPSEYAAQQAADYVNSKHFGLNFVPYQCNKCLQYHIRPKEYFINKTQRVCTCVDSKGNPKEAYQIPGDAQKVVRLWAKKGAHLSIYRCPKGNGWHLTSHEQKRRVKKTVFVIPEPKNFAKTFEEILKNPPKKNYKKRPKKNSKNIHN